MKEVFHRPTVQVGLVPSEPLFGDVAGAPLTIGQNVKAHGQQFPKQSSRRGQRQRWSAGAAPGVHALRVAQVIRVMAAFASAVTTNKGSPR